MESIRKVLGNRLRSLREARGFTQDQLAFQAKVSLQTVTFVETGRRWAGSNILEKMLAALEVTPDELFSPSPIEIRPTPAEALAVLADVLRENERLKARRGSEELEDLAAGLTGMSEDEVVAQLRAAEDAVRSRPTVDHAKPKRRASSGSKV